MSGLVCAVSIENVALSATVAKTVLQLRAVADHRVKLLKWGVFFQGTSPSAEPVDVKLVRQSTSGTMTTVNAVALQMAGSETIQTTAGYTATVEPTETNILDVKAVHPQSGYECIFPLGQEIYVPGGGFLGIKCTAPATAVVSAVFWFDE